MDLAKITEIDAIDSKIADLKDGIDKAKDIVRNTERALANAKQMQVNIIASNRPHQDQRDNLLNIRNLIIDLDSSNEAISLSNQLMNQLNHRRQALVKEA